MEFVNLIITACSTVVCIFGGGIGISGLTTYLEGRSQGTSGKKDEGMEKMLGGCGIIAIGVFLVPQLSSLFTF